MFKYFKSNLILFTISILSLYGTSLFAADTITINPNGKPVSVIVPNDHRVSEATEALLGQIKQGIFTNLHISYAGPLNGKDSVAFKLMLANLENIIHAEIHITDPALRNDDPNWTLESNLFDAAKALLENNAIVITPVGDSSLFTEYNGEQTIRVTTLEILSFLTGIPQSNSSYNNFENIIGGHPLGGRLADPIQIGDEQFYVFIRTEPIFSEDVSKLRMNSQQDLLDLWQIILGTTVDPVNNQNIYHFLPSHYTLLLDWLMALESSDDEALAA